MSLRADPTSSRLRNHDDLAELLVALHVALRLDDLLQREGLGDDRLQLTCLKPLYHPFDAGLQLGRIEGRVEQKSARNDMLFVKTGKCGTTVGSPIVP